MVAVKRRETAARHRRPDYSTDKSLVLLVRSDSPSPEDLTSCYVHTHTYISNRMQYAYDQTENTLYGLFLTSHMRISAPKFVIFSFSVDIAARSNREISL